MGKINLGAAFAWHSIGHLLCQTEKECNRMVEHGRLSKILVLHTSSMFWVHNVFVLQDTYCTCSLLFLFVHLMLHT